MKRKIKLKVIDYIIVLLCLAGAVFSGAAFWNEYNKTLVKLNEDSVGIIIFKKRVAQRKFIDRGVWDRLKQTSPVYNGDTIRTIEQSEAIIIFQDEVTYLSMDESTMIQVFYNNQGGARIDFSGGGLEVASESKNFVISSGDSTIVLDRKARLNKHEKELILSVFDGKASFDEIEIGAGNILAFDSNGELSTKPVISMTSFASSAYVLGSPPLSKDGTPIETVPVVFSWNALNFDADTFVIVEVAKDRAFNRLVEIRDVIGASSVSIPLENGNYFWRAYPVEGSQSAEGPKTADSRTPVSRLYPSGKLEVIPVAAAILLSPSQDEEFTFSGKSPIPFSWTAIESASSYLLEISARMDMANPVVSRLVEESSVVQSPLDYGRWYWRVTPVFPAQMKGEASSSEVGEFSVVGGSPVLAAPVLTFPSHNGKMYADSSSNRLLWAHDPNASSWLVELADNPGMASPIVKQDVANNFFPLSRELLLNGKTWYWRVTAMGDTQGSAGSAVSVVRRFEVGSGAVPVAKPVLAALPYIPPLPPVVFGANIENWNELDAETIAYNEKIFSSIVLTLNTYGEYKLRVEGHANSTVSPGDIEGSILEEKEELEPLSEMRARAVVNHLVMLGIDRNRLEFLGLGGKNPIAAWDDVKNWWKNRRAELILIR